MAFFGFANAEPSEPLYKEVRAVARTVARAGYGVVNGGGPGLMRAASEGAKLGGGKSVGVTFYPKEETIFEGRDPANPLDEEIKTESYLERTLKLLELGDVYLIFQGGSGTVSEFGMAWGLARIYFGHHKPLILYGSFWHDILESIGRNMRLRSEELKVYRIVDSPDEVLQAIADFEKDFRK